VPRTRIHVNTHIIRRNCKTGEREPPIGVETQGRRKRYARGVRINGPVQLIYSPDKPLPCGARLWLETMADVVLVGEAKRKECDG